MLSEIGWTCAVNGYCVHIFEPLWSNNGCGCVILVYPRSFFPIYVCLLVPSCKTRLLITSFPYDMIVNVGRQHYRLYTIQSIPSLKVLDHQKITQTERDRAKRLAGSAAGAALESDIQDEAGRQKTFTPGEGASAEESFVVNFTAEEKEQIRQMVANAQSPEEIEEIERSVQRGVLPKNMQRTSNKRPLISEIGDENGSSEKKIKS